MPWKGKTWERPTLGGKDLPFPRRLTSNRPVWKDTEFETAVKDPYPFLDVFVVWPLLNLRLTPVQGVYQGPCVPVDVSCSAAGTSIAQQQQQQL